MQANIIARVREAGGDESFADRSVRYSPYRTYAGIRLGETATIYFPKSEGGRVLLSIENALKVVSRRWVATYANRETVCKIPVTREMTPNFYVHAMLLQLHAWCPHAYCRRHFWQQHLGRYRCGVIGFLCDDLLKDVRNRQMLIVRFRFAH